MVLQSHYTCNVLNCIAHLLHFEVMHQSFVITAFLPTGNGGANDFTIFGALV